LEVLKDAAMQEGQTEPEPSLKEWAEADEKSLESSRFSKTWRRSRLIAAG
jgi:hypothetical protein